MHLGTFTRLSNEKVAELTELVKFNKQAIICDVCPFDKTTCPCHLKDDTVVNALIESHIPLALKIAGKVSRISNRNCVIGAALLILTETVHKIPSLEDTSKLGAYIRITLTHKLRQFIISDGVIRVTHHEASQLQNPLPLTANTVAVQPSQLFDWQDFLQNYIKDSCDELLAKQLLGSGASLIEISRKCHVSQPQVCRAKATNTVLVAGL
jgi:hypothetical protein